MDLPVFAAEEVLERVDGDLDFLNELTTEFLASFPSQFEELTAAVKASDFKLAERFAHSIKGTLRNLGGTKSGESADKLETAARKDNLSQAPQMLEELEKGVKEFEMEFKQFIAAKKS